MTEISRDTFLALLSAYTQYSFTIVNVCNSRSLYCSTAAHINNSRNPVLNFTH